MRVRSRLVSCVAVFLAASSWVAPARAQVAFSVVHGFAGPDGAYPNAPLVAGAGGVLYGTTVSFGPPGNVTEGGVVYSLTPSGGRWSESVLHVFAGAPADGSLPHSRLLIGQSGELYGTTGRGGRHDNGTIYRLEKPQAGASEWKETILYSFTGGIDGAYPESELVADLAGCLYGSASGGGGQDQLGTIYQLCPPASPHAAWVMSTLYSFNGPDGAFPYGGLVARVWGGMFTLFGTASGGGSADQGTVFLLAAPQQGQTTWQLSTLHMFSGQDEGAVPLGTLWADGEMNLYGTASQGGLFPVNSAVPGGVVFKLSPPTPPVPGQPGPSAWTELVLHRFAGGADGIYPTGGVVEAAHGHLFGVTVGAGFEGCTSGCGTLFELSPVDYGGHRAPWYERVLHSFTGADGNLPSAALAPVTNPISGALSLYGVTEYGGAGKVGTVFSVTP